MKREYIKKEGKAFEPTELGIRIEKFLIEAFPSFMDFGYTVRVEDKLDDIANNGKVWYDIVQNFWLELEGYLEASKNIGDKIKFNPKGSAKFTDDWIKQLGNYRKLTVTFREKSHFNGDMASYGFKEFNDTEAHWVFVDEYFELDGIGNNFELST